MTDARERAHEVSVAAQRAAATVLVPQGRAPLTDTVRALFAYIGTTLMGNALGGVLLLLLFLGTAPPTTLLAWAAAFGAVLAFRSWAGHGFRRNPPADEAGAQAWLLRWNLGALASGAVWGSASWLFFGLGSTPQMLALLLIVNSMCYGAIPLLAAQRKVFIAFVILAFVPAMVAVAIRLGPPGWPLVGLMVVIFIMSVVLGGSFNRMFEDMVELKIRAQRLLEQLREEKAAAEAARREAEAANRAKTQFFAAASHDLRQPLHAMGLFAEALRGKSQDVEVVQLVNSINGSVDALEGLFSELLDITKIDSGGVEVQPLDFRLDEVLRKLKLHFEPVAFEKGLALRLRGGRHAALADPLLVERILRNLTSNAIRYTEDGTVLVSVRQRGDKLLLQVWDSGPGIAPADLERVFEEFVQLDHSARDLSPNQRKGLGLGLSIVKRLAQLMNAPLSVRSTPGRGTVFTLELPRGKPPKPGQPQPGSRAPLGLTLAKRHIVMVEDDEAVNRGLQVLLQGWGAEVSAFDSVAACQRWLDSAPAGSPAPDLAIVDYRLESGHTGIEALAAIRKRFGAPVPAIMVTGSMMTGHESEAQQNDFHLLLKPVVPNKLRAMIAFKLGMR
ncbi:signal transduction histidine kinase [Burkholderiales bacterium JOSHI_001]|nr:signal transduction histidine kinase [Burkholderiales bacterium JOSHI_001]